MSTIYITYFLIAPNHTGGLAINPEWAYASGPVAALVITGMWYRLVVKRRQ
ncbi:MAG: hypothetical protein PF590_10225 [Candidatus Delongbacteria bacterium]|nr:hypothetical protein [Candidatus Delongbacteria bacterium]